MTDLQRRTSRGGLPVPGLRVVVLEMLFALILLAGLVLLVSLGASTPSGPEMPLPWVETTSSHVAVSINPVSSVTVSLTV